MNQFVMDNGGILVPVLGGVALLALVMAVVSATKLRAMTRQFGWVKGQNGDGGGADSLSLLLGAVESNGRAIGELQRNLSAAVDEARTHFKHVGLVRYDAFEGVAGQQSFSLCLLNADHTGFVLSNLVGTDFTRAYAVEINRGEASRKLGDEETRAYEKSLGKTSPEPQPARS